MSDGDAAITDLADRQQCVVAASQLLALGYTRNMIRGRITASRLLPVHDGVYSVGHRTLTPKGRWMAAVLAYGPNAFLSHRSAAALWGLRPTAQFAADVTVPGTSRKRRRRINVHRARRVHPQDVSIVDGIPVTSVSRTILDLASVLATDPLLRVTEQADRMKLLNLSSLDRAIERCPNHKGVKQLRKILADYRGAPDTRSGLERRFLALIRRAGLPEPQLNVVVAGLPVDFFWPDWRLVVEVDSRGYHANPRKFESDRRWDATLQRARCRVLRVTEQRMEEPESVIEDIIALSRLAA